MATKPETPKTEVAVAKPQGGAVAMPGNWRDRMKSIAVKTAETEKPTGSNISFKAGRLTIGDTVMPGDKIDCIIVDALFHNKYFSTDYDSKRIVPPDCYAFAREEPDLQPSKGAEDPQGGEEGFCAGCPMNEWGSSRKGGRGKACTNSRRLWLLPAGAVNDPSKIGRMDLLTCDLPATSVRNYSKFATDAAAAGAAPFQFVVEMSVKPHDDYLFQVHFKAMEQIKNDEVLEQLANRQWKLENEPHPVYPTKEEMEERNAPANTSKKY